jgi:hypothetical protein
MLAMRVSLTNRSTLTLESQTAAIKKPPCVPPVLHPVALYIDRDRSSTPHTSGAVLEHRLRALSISALQGAIGHEPRPADSG